MLMDDLHTTMVRELRALAREVAAYPTDAALWQSVPGIANPGGNLALHLAGNIQYFLGAVLGGSGYKRDRDAEFGSRDLTRAAVVAEVEKALAAVERTFPKVTAAQWGAEFPVEVGGRKLVTSRFVAHLAVHLAYHLGQVDYHRRIVAPASGTVGAIAVTEL